MGRLFIEKFENNTVVYCCSLCKAEIFQNKDIIVEHIETTFGKCYGVSNVLNINSFETQNDSCLNITSRVSTYDNDAVFDIQNVKSKEVLCKRCYLHLGWLHDGQSKLFVILCFQVLLQFKK